MKFALVLLSGFTFLTGYAQVKIGGVVRDSKGRGLAGASISIKNSYDGSTSDSLGNFSFQSTENGSQVLVVSMSGFKPYEESITITSSEISKLILLKELITELNAVVITAGSFEAGDKKKGAVLTSLDIVTTASANADITGALKTLPGTQQVGESEGLFVRGGSATESKIFIDGSLVNNFFYSSLPGIATRGRFNPFLFKGTVFSAGGYSALYGQALSAALVLESTDLPERTQADLSLSVIGIGTGIQKLSADKRSSWGATYNYTNLAMAFAVIPQKQDFFNTPVYHQGDFNFRFRTKNGGFVKYYSYLSWNKLGFSSPDIDSSSLNNAFELRNLNSYHNVNWKESFANGWKTFVAFSASTNKDNINNELRDQASQKQVITDPIGYAFKNFRLKSTGLYAQARAVIEKRIQGLNTLRFGSDYFYNKERSVYNSFNGDIYSQDLSDQLTSVFAEADFYLSKDLAAKTGVRSEYSDLMGRWNLAPRLSVAYKLKNQGQVSFAYGLFYQNPESRYLPAFDKLPGYSRASHYILQYQKLKNQRSFRAEVFYKDYERLYKTGAGMSGRQVISGDNGSGYAKGLEFFWRDKKTFKNLDYWFSYSFLDTERDYLNFPGAMTPNFAARHTASLVMKKFSVPLKTGFNASYSYASGRPYYNIQFDNSLQKNVLRDAGRTISYGNLGFSLNYLPNLGKTNKKAFIVWVLSVTNVLGQKQEFGYNYASMSDKKELITPPAKRFVFLGCFMSFGIDRTQDAINNNL